DLGIVPFNQYFTKIKLFNFYDLEIDKEKQKDLNKQLTETKYFIIPSQRILESRKSRPDLFPKGNAFYTMLLQGINGYKKVYQTPCDLYCQLLYFGNPIYSYEQTANVFDRPSVIIYEKNN